MNSLKILYFFEDRKHKHIVPYNSIFDYYLLFFILNRFTEYDKNQFIIYIYHDARIARPCQLLNTLYVVGSDTDPFGGDDNEQVNPHDFGYNYAC